MNSQAKQDPFFKTSSRGGDLHVDTDIEFQEDLTYLKSHCEALYEDFGCDKVEVERGRLWPVLSNIQTVLSRNAATPNPSLFKRSAAFTISFMEHPPLDIPFSASKLPERLVAIKNHHNAIAAFEFCRRALIDADIHKAAKDPSKSPTIVRLVKPIKLSQHSYHDVIHAIATMNCLDAFHLTSLLYETLTYRFNPEASYEAIV